MKVVANGRVMNLMGAVAFELPKVTAVQPSNSPTFGGIFVTLSGTLHASHQASQTSHSSPHIPSGEHFGFLDTSPNMGLASSGCEESHWISDSSMLCKIFPGVGGNLAVSAFAASASKCTENAAHLPACSRARIRWASTRAGRRMCRKFRRRRWQKPSCLLKAGSRSVC